MVGMAGTLSTLPRPQFHSNFNQLSKHKNPNFPLNCSSNFSQFTHLSPKLSTTHFNSHKTQFENVDNQDDFIILGIETSCDDTCAAVVRGNGEILSQVVSSQADLLAQYGGVDPKRSAEAHAMVINEVTQSAIDQANVAAKDLSAVAVTIGPGLSLCLRVGVQKAREIACNFQLPIVGVHHMEAHTLVARLTNKDLQFPFLVLLISGGHNLLILARDLGHYIQLGTTIDDAIGEAYDKIAKWLGLDLRRSGGPAIEELAREGDPHSVKLKVPMLHHKDCNFSYAGLKTQVRLAIGSKDINAGIPISSASIEDRKSRADIAASFQRVAVSHLEERCERAMEWAMKIEPSVKYFVVSGGVASNQYVRARLGHVVNNKGLQLVCPPPRLCTDNGVMVAWTGIEHFHVGRFDPPPPIHEAEDSVYDIRPRWPLGEEYAEGRSKYSHPFARRSLLSFPILSMDTELYHYATVYRIEWQPTAQKAVIKLTVASGDSLSQDHLVLS